MSADSDDPGGDAAEEMADNLKEASEKMEMDDAPSDTITLSVSFSPSTGALGLYGPIHDQITCLGLLCMAQDQLLRRAVQGPQPQGRILSLDGGGN